MKNHDFASQNLGFKLVSGGLGVQISSKVAPKPSETKVLRGKIMFFQDISRNFDMGNSIFCIRVFMIIKLLETKNETFLRVSRI